MANITRFMVRYKDPYARPARYSTATKFVLETDDGERHEYLCGNKFKSYNEFIKEMQKRHGDNISIDRQKPYVLYQ